MAKRRPFNPGFFPWTKDDYHKISWCINHGIKCCVVHSQGFAGPGQEYCVEIIIKDKSNFSPNFKKDEVLIKQLEYYNYYYDKYNKSAIK
jgi:hypothetical protein